MSDCRGVMSVLEGYEFVRDFQIDRTNTKQHWLLRVVQVERGDAVPPASCAIRQELGVPRRHVVPRLVDESAHPVHPTLEQRPRPDISITNAILSNRGFLTMVPPAVRARHCLHFTRECSCR